ncbi:MAG TPA: VOC family protein [Anaerolineae bacterium]|nr:VOC family protein [Anaerolineae bacterium]
MMPKLFVITLWAEDVTTCAHFYRDVIGLPLIDVRTDPPHFDLDGAYLVIRKTRSAPLPDREIDRFPIVAFSIDDLDSAIDRLQQHHIDLPREIEADNGGRWIMFYDPGGNLIELTQRTP